MGGMPTQSLAAAGFQVGQRGHGTHTKVISNTGQALSRRQADQNLFRAAGNSRDGCYTKAQQDHWQRFQRVGHMADMRSQAVVGILPPSMGEARVAMRRPTVAAYPIIPPLACKLQELAKSLIIGSINLSGTADAQNPRALKRTNWIGTLLTAIGLLITMPLGVALCLLAWLMLAPLFAMKLLPFFMTRYVVTNRRVMIQKGWSLRVAQEVKLEELDQVRVAPGSEQPFYQSANLEIVSNGKVLMTLVAVPEYEQFRIIMENAYLSWGRKNPPKQQVVAAKAS